jgi:threonylcarbamoyladenosine tRNA methylthiotransferase CDKAL1
MKIHIYTQGCTANQSDSEVIAGLLKESGYALTTLKDADLVIFNTCSLKSPTEQSLFRKIQDISKTKKIIISGCFPLSFSDDKRLEKYSILGSFDLKKVVEAVDKTLKGKRVVFLNRKAEEKLCLPKVRDNKKIAKVVISKGCLSACTFCAGKKARGNLVSYSPEKILKEIKQSIANGCSRIYLTCQDTGCYGYDIKTNIVELIKQIIKIEGNFKIRIGMMSPQWAIKLQSELIEIYKHPKVLKFFHIPIQSGSDKILRLMNRQYTISDFKKVVENFRKEIPKIEVATDIIVGFPEETEIDFQKTIDILNWLKPAVLNSTKYWPRKGTVAGDKYFDSIDNPNSIQSIDISKIKQQRASIIHNLFNKIKKERKESVHLPKIND